jgi:hypothetical protein
MATVVAIITSMVAANATQTITTPNATFISYNLAAGANSTVITPTTSKSVLVMGCCTSFYGVGQVSLFHIPSANGGGFGWVGLEAYNGTPVANTGGLIGNGVAHIVWIDYEHKVDIQTASADTILVHNGSTGTRAGNVTLVW